VQLTAETICRDCNGGWMSDLESRAATLLKPVLGDPNAVINLDLRAQADLALWAARTALTYQQTRPPRFQAAIAAHYRWIRDKQEPPPCTSIRLAFYFSDTNTFPVHYFRETTSGGGVPDPSRDGADLEREVPLVGYRTVILIGPVVFEILGTSAFEPIPMWWHGGLKPTLTSLWPIAQRVATVPPGIVIGDPAMEIFVEPPNFKLVRGRTRAGVPYIKPG
jgi:hypothetical protein